MPPSNVKILRSTDGTSIFAEATDDPSKLQLASHPCLWLDLKWLCLRRHLKEAQTPRASTAERPGCRIPIDARCARLCRLRQLDAAAKADEPGDSETRFGRQT